MQRLLSKGLQGGYSLLLIGIIFWLFTGNAQAVVTCKAGMNTAPGSVGVVNISNAITPTNADYASITATLNYSCTNYGGLLPRKVSVCLAADSGEYYSASVNPRYLKNRSGTQDLAFTMKLPGEQVWGTRTGGGSEYKITLENTLFIGESLSGSVPIQISLLPSNGNKLATPGVYSNNFDGAHTALTFQDIILVPLFDCATGSQDAIRFPFIVQATVVADCQINTTSDINLGNYSARSSHIAGGNSNALAVTCTNGAPYNIGLAPSNGNINGEGVMSGTGNNSDKIAYQLRATAGPDGKIWGNTATATKVGNGLAKQGTGSAQAQAVYVTVADADFKPDTYSDTVTIRINY